MSLINKVYTGTTNEKTLVYNSGVVISELTLQTGTYLLLGYSQVSLSVDGSYILYMTHSRTGAQIATSIVRNISMIDGGGSQSVCIISISGPETIKLYLFSNYNGTISSSYSYLYAIKLS